MCSVTANAYDFEVNGIYYNIISTTDLTVEVTNGDNKYSGEVIIPNIIIYKSRTLTVTSIGYKAFYICSGLTSIEIPNSVTSIGTSAFKNCSGLKSITIPNSVTSIGDDAFLNCSGLTSATIGNGVTSIGNGMFNGCTSLKDLRIEDGKDTLSLGYKSYNSSGYGKGLFYDCPLETLYLGRNLSYNAEFTYGYSPFYNKTKLASVTIGNSVTSIGNYAFSGCSDLTNVEIPNSVTSIGSDAFYECSGLTNVEIPNSVTSIGSYVFYECSGLTSVEIPNSVTSIGEDAFYGCSGLTSVEIPNSVTNIGSYAFSRCSGLTSIVIPNSVTSIGSYAFYDCDGLTSVEIGNGVTSIGSYAFENCSKIKKVELDCTTIGTWFKNSSIKEVVLGDNVTSIGSNAFSGCSGITKISLMGTTPPAVDSNNFTNTHFINSTVYVPQGALDAYQAADVWKDFWDIREEGTTEMPGVDVEVKKCAAPVITYSNSGLDIISETDDAEFHTKITCSDIGSYNDGRIDLSATYNITTYATKTGYLNSETVTATLCWIAVSGDSEDNSIIKVEAMPVLITCNNGTINICGGKEGAEVVVYTTSGVAVGNATITNGNATISTGLAKGEIAVVNIAGKGIKVVMQ